MASSRRRCHFSIGRLAVTLILNIDDVKRATTIRTLIDSIEQGLREEAQGQVVMPPRLNLAAKSGFFRIMPAVMNGSSLMGFKAFHGGGKAGVRYLIAVYEQESGRLLALMDAHYLTAARTGATTGVATKYLANPDAKTVGVIGSGLEARTNLQAVCAVRAIEQVKAFSPNPHRRHAFAQWVEAELGIRAMAVDSPEAAVADADIIVVATNTSRSPDPIAFRGIWMRPSVHVNSIGSTMPTLREIDPETFRRADRIVVDSAVQVEEESGDVIAAIKEGKYDKTRLAELKDIVAGQVKGRLDAREITLFKSVGTALQDVMAGFAVYEEAVRQGLGQDVGEFLEVKTFGS